MAGGFGGSYLGTMFMGGVGLRLLLPPVSQFGKLVTRVQETLKRSGEQSIRLSSMFGAKRRQKLVTEQEAAQKLVKGMETTYDREKRIRLQAHFAKINELNKNAAMKGQEALNKLASGKATWKNVKATVESDLQDVGQAVGPLGQLTDKIQDNLDKIYETLFNIGRHLVGAFMNAIQRSTMFIITFGFQVGMMARNFITFEKELINANSIFQTTRENLYAMSDELIKFGFEFGINYQDASKVLYQFASAGLTAQESMVALRDTLTLTMAVQGDFNTLGKLMVQVIKGFGLEMSDTEEIADKFAYTINKSLIEWKDLSAAVKFAMPFFVAAGQSIDQLLGSLQILTDRALEAGIAGRGLRQAIAQFVEHADDNNAAFRKLGVEILDTEGNMRELTDIALQFSAAMGEDVSKMDIMMTLMEDLNIRGATAFVHLAQNAEEFQKAVDDLVNSQGASNEMAEYQQASLTNQIQLLKNAMFSVFYLSDAAYAGTGAINGFDYAIKKLVQDVKSKFIITMADGTQKLTDFGFKMRDVVINFIEHFADILLKVVDIFMNLADSGSGLFDTMTVLFWAIKEVVDVLVSMDPELLKIVFQLWLLNNLFGTGVGLAVAFGLAMTKLGNWLNDLSPILAFVGYWLLVIVGALAGGIIGAVQGALIGFAAGAMIGPQAAIAGAIGGAVIGGATGALAGGAATGVALSTVGSMAEGAMIDSAAGGANAAPLDLYSSGGASTLVVENAIFTNDNLPDRFTNGSLVGG